MKLTNTEQLKLQDRVRAVREKWGDRGSYTKAYIAAFGKKKTDVDTIRNVWSYKGLSTNIPVIENLEKLVSNAS